MSFFMRSTIISWQCYKKSLFWQLTCAKGNLEEEEKAPNRIFLLAAKWIR